MDKLEKREWCSFCSEVRYSLSVNFQTIITQVSNFEIFLYSEVEDEFLCYTFLWYLPIVWHLGNCSYSINLDGGTALHIAACEGHRDSVRVAAQLEDQHRRARPLGKHGEPPSDYPSYEFCVVKSCSFAFPIIGGSWCRFLRPLEGLWCMISLKFMVQGYIADAVLAYIKLEN
jgi:hypothetical protein